MPTVWEDIDSNNFEAVLTHIRQNPKKIKETRPGLGYDLPMYILFKTLNKEKSENLKNLIIEILTNDEVNWEFKKGSQSTLGLIIQCAKIEKNFELMEALNKVPGFIRSGETTSYKFAIARLEQEIIFLKDKKDPQIEPKIEEFKKIIDLIRDISILHAIDTDNLDLFKALEEDGAKPLDTLGTFGKAQNPLELINYKNPPQIKAWVLAKYEAQKPAKPAKPAKLAKPVVDAPVSDIEARILENARQRELAAARQAVLQRELANRTAMAQADLAKGRQVRMEEAHASLTREQTPVNSPVAGI